MFKKDIKYIDENTRIEFGFHFSELGRSYQLQRKIGNRWKRKAWSYSQFTETFDELKDYLLWSEIKNEKERIEKKIPLWGRNGNNTQEQQTENRLP